MDMLMGSIPLSLPPSPGHSDILIFYEDYFCCKLGSGDEFLNLINESCTHAHTCAQVISFNTLLLENVLYYYYYSVIYYSFCQI